MDHNKNVATFTKELKCSYKKMQKPIDDIKNMATFTRN